MMSDLSVVGLGAMGSALAAAFLNRGLVTTVWNRSPEKADALVAKGALRPSTAAEAVEASNLVVVCLLNYLTVYEALGGAGGALSGRVLVNLTNGTPLQARDMAKWAADRGAEYVDGAIMAIPPMIGQRAALLLYSGSKSGFDAHRQVLESLGTGQYLGSDAGLAPLYDAALLIGMYGIFAGALHAMALVGTEGIAARELMPVLTPWMNAMMGGLPGLAEQVDTGDHTKDVTSNLEMQAVAYANLMEASRAQGVSTELIAPMHHLMNRGVAAGYGAADLSSLVDLLRNSSSLSARG